MFEEPIEDPAEGILGAKERAQEKADEFRMHAEIAAVFEGPRKFDAELLPGLNADVARNLQRSMAKLEKSKTTGIPILPDESAKEAADVLLLPAAHELSTNDYHIHRRPGEVMIARWIEGEQVESFYDRLQAHFDAAMNAFRADERSTREWKQDPKTLAYLDALDAIDLKMADSYLRNIIREHNVFVLSTQTADEMNIAYIAEHVMGATPADVVGTASAPPDEASEQDLAWFYKLFALRGIIEGIERMCFFTFLQKSDDSF